MSTRKEYIEKLAARLREWDDQIDGLRTKAEQAKADAKVRYKEQVVELKGFRDRAETLLGEMHESTDATWNIVKAKVDELYSDVKKIFKKAA